MWADDGLALRGNPLPTATSVPAHDCQSHVSTQPFDQWSSAPAKWSSDHGPLDVFGAMPSTSPMSSSSRPTQVRRLGRDSWHRRPREPDAHVAHGPVDPGERAGEVG